MIDKLLTAFDEETTNRQSNKQNLKEESS